MKTITTADGIQRNITRREGRVIWCSPEHTEVPSARAQSRIACDVSGFPSRGDHEFVGIGGRFLRPDDHGDAISHEQDLIDRNKARWEAKQRAKKAEQAELLRLSSNNARPKQRAATRAVKPVTAPVRGIGPGPYVQLPRGTPVSVMA